MKSYFPIVFLPIFLIGCTSSLEGKLGTVSSGAQGLESTLDATLNNLILQKAQDLHNLGVALSQINNTPGMVSVVTPPPVVAQPAPTPVVMNPVPTPTSPPVTTTPTPIVPTPPTSPPTGTNPPANLP